MEEWRDVVRYEGLYEVSSLGRVRRNANILTPWLAGGTGERWYNYVGLSKGGVVEKVRVNILTATAFIPNLCNHPVVDHRNGVSTDDRVENLRWVTRRENFLNPTNKVRPVGKSGHKCIFPNREKWMVRCMINGSTHYVGTFKTLEEAIRARDDFLNK